MAKLDFHFAAFSQHNIFSLSLHLDSAHSLACLETDYIQPDIDCKQDLISLAYCDML